MSTEITQNDRTKMINKLCRGHDCIGCKIEKICTAYLSRTPTATREEWNAAIDRFIIKARREHRPKPAYHVLNLLVNPSDRHRTIYTNDPEKIIGLYNIVQSQILLPYPAENIAILAIQSTKTHAETIVSGAATREQLLNDINALNTPAQKDEHYIFFKPGLYSTNRPRAYVYYTPVSDIDE